MNIWKKRLDKVLDHNRFEAKTMTSQIHLKTQNKGDTMDQF